MNTKSTGKRDDWQEETANRLKQYQLYRALEKKAKSDPAVAQVISLVLEAVHYSYHRSKLILRHMGEFTLHDGDHQFRVLFLIEKLLPPGTADRLTAPEAMLLILTAFFHDIGMAPSEDEVLSWKKVWDKDPGRLSTTQRIEYERFQRYCASRPDEMARIKAFEKQENFSQGNLARGYLISDYIRTTHADRARQIINNDWVNKIVYRDTDLTSEFAALCLSHNQDAQVLLDMERDYLCGPGVHACLPLVGVLLRLADILDFDAKRTPAVLFSHLFVRHPVSLSEWSKHRSVEAWDITSDHIQYSVKCDHPAIEASLHDFCDLIDKELSHCGNIINSLLGNLSARQHPLSIRLPLKVDRSKIATKRNIDGSPKYLYRRTEFTLSKSQVIDLLMGTKLYGNPQVALRELIQNSIDACLLRQALENSWGNNYIPEIAISYLTENGEDVLEVTDNGTGMDQDIIDRFYTKVGSSFYKSAEFYDLKSQTNAQFVPTSRFGIGILSAFMVADTLVVDTRRVYGPHDSSAALQLTIEGQESIFWIQGGVRKTPGTKTKLVLRASNNPWKGLTESQFIDSVEGVVTNPPFKVTITGGKKVTTRNENSFSNSSAKSLKNHTWNEKDNIREFAFAFDDANEGFVGSVVVAILQQRGKPVSVIKMTSRKIKVDNVEYTLEKAMSMSGDGIKVESSSITVDDEGDVHPSKDSNEMCESRSRISLHGIEIPTTLFPDYWERRQNTVRINWPFPALLILDVCGESDLDLNSSRTHILRTEKWSSFEEKLTKAVCKRLAAAVSPKYWAGLMSVLRKLPHDVMFDRCLREASDSVGVSFPRIRAQRSRSLG